MIEEILKHCRKGPGGRRLLTSEQKRRIVEVWQQSGLSAPEFCRRHDLQLAILYKWRKDSIRGA
jgi:transposase-like protein